MRALLAIFVSSLLWSVSPNLVLAHNPGNPGTASCQWEGPGQLGTCNPVNNCQNGAIPPPSLVCASRDTRVCNAGFGRCVFSDIRPCATHQECSQDYLDNNFDAHTGCSVCPDVKGTCAYRATCVNDPSPKTEGPVAAQGVLVTGYTPTPCGAGGIQTGLGCIPVGNTTDFIAWFLRWAIGIAGGIAFLLILYSGFQIITSGGDPEKLKAGKELLTSAIAGLILIIFSVFLLRLIGVEILKIPGF